MGYVSIGHDSCGVGFVFGIRVRLMGGFILVALFTGAVGLNAAASGERLNTSRDELYSQAFGGARGLGTWLNQARLSESHLSAFMFEDDPQARDGLRAEMTAEDAQLASPDSTISPSGPDRSDAQNVLNLRQSWRSYADWRDQSIMVPVESGRWVDARAAFQAESDARNATLNDAITAFSDAENANALALEASADAEAALQGNIAAGLTAAAILLALLIGYFLARDIARAAGEIATAAKGLAIGDLNQHISISSHDELGQMASAMRSTIAYQRDMAEVARVMATGDLTQNVTPRSTADALGFAFEHMIANLRQLMSDLQQQTDASAARAELLELANDAIIVTNLRTGLIQFWNHGAEQTYGWTRTDALGQTTQALLTTRFPGSSSTVDAELLRSGRWDGELIHTRRDGAALVVASRQTLQRDDAGTPVAVLEINIDVTTRKRVEDDRIRLAALVDHERNTLAAILASMTDGVIQVNDDRQVVFSNPQAAAMLGTTVDILTRSTVADVFAHLRSSLHDADAVRAAFNVPLADRPSFEIVFKGTPQRHLLNQRFAIGATGAMGIILHDLTAERELVRAKDELLSMVSHELASPATSLVACAAMLAEHDEYSAAERQDLLATIVGEGQRLTAIIQDFLDIQRLEHGRFQLSAHPMELRTLLDHAARVASTDTEHPFTLDVPPDLPLIQADPNRVQQVLANLLSNARKYTPAGGRVWLSARLVDTAVEISVTDEGLGIPLEAQPHLFETFYRVDADDRRQIKGTGLGLAIVKEIIEALSGTIGAESAGPGHGSRFWFTLPLAEAAAIEHASDETAPPLARVELAPSSPLRVLVVDDDAAICTTVRRVLHRDGHQVTTTTSAEEALEQCRAHPFDVVLTDLGLGSGMDGWELAERIRREWPGLPVILASGRLGIDMIEAHSRGVAALLSKPYQADDLRRLIIDIGRSTIQLAA